MGFCETIRELEIFFTKKWQTSDMNSVHSQRYMPNSKYQQAGCYDRLCLESQIRDSICSESEMEGFDSDTGLPLCMPDATGGWFREKQESRNELG